MVPRHCESSCRDKYLRDINLQDLVLFDSKQFATLFNEEEFLRMATSELFRVPEVTIVSHTPILFFKKEAVGAGQEYAQALARRFETPNLVTNYFMSEQELSRSIAASDPDLPGRMLEMARWRSKWAERKNLLVLVVRSNYFPSVSFWIGKKPSFAFIKIRFENDAQPSLWLKLESHTGIDQLVSNLREHSMEFGDFLTKYSKSLDFEP